VALGRVALRDTLLVGPGLTADARKSDPFADPAADLRVGALYLHHVRAFLAHAVMVGADAQVHDIAGNAGGDVEWVSLWK
jgi:hypothetical protein